VPVPAPLLGSLLAQIDDIAELKCTLRAVALLSQKRGYPRFVTLQELQADENLASAISADGDVQPATQIERALGSAVRRGTLAFAVVVTDGRRQPIFGLNSEADRAALEKLASQPSRWSGTYQEPPDPSVERPNVFEMYEQNIGMLSPMIADALLEAEDMYPEDWIEDAIGEAVEQNKRSWRYISRILERWEHEGRGPRDIGGAPRMAGRY
jgi:DnaD/phage-associated family protein